MSDATASEYGGEAYLLLDAQTDAMPQQASAQCNVNTQSVSFGNHDTFGSQHLDGVGSIAVSCSGTAAYTISLSPGAGSCAVRSMTNGPYRLDYNLYTNAFRCGASIHTAF